MPGATTDKFALVTGAGSGTGRAAALGLSAAGWRVALLGRQEATLRETASLGEVKRFQILSADVSDPAQVQQAFDRLEAEWGRLDLLFNNAGIGAPAATIDSLPVEKWLEVIGINLTGSFLCARAAFALMRRQMPPGGRIVNNGSISSQVPRPQACAYTASKHAITGLTKTIALDGRPFGISCGQIDIGNAATSLTGQMAEGVLQANGSVAPEPTIDVQHVADTLVLMASLPPRSQTSRFVTVMATNMPLLGRG